MSEQKSVAERYADVEQAVGEIADQLADAPPNAKQALAALMQHTRALTVIEYCPDCEKLLSVSPLSDSAWSVTCPCGRSNNSFRGL